MKQGRRESPLFEKVLMKSFYQCECLDKALKARHGEFIHLPYADARSLQASGHVRISDKDYVNEIREVQDTDYMYHSNWSKRRTTRIAWCQNYEKNGGAEISNFNVIKIGKNLGFDIVGWNLSGENPGVEVLQGADLVILANLHYVDDAKSTLLKWLYKNEKPFVKYDHDCFEEEKSIYLKSKLNIFISPKHKKYYVDLCGEVINDKSTCLPLAFNVDSWASKGEHTPGTVFIPSYEKCRGNVFDFIRDNPQYNYYVSSEIAPSGKNVFQLGKINYDKMKEYYPRYETVYHCPLERCAGERILFEAVMSGCKVITNEHAGHTSWDFDWRDEKVLRPILSKAVYEFWAAVDKVLK